MLTAASQSDDEETVSLIRDSASRFLKSEYPRLFDQARADASAIWTAFADLGWLALPVAQSAGGLGGSLPQLAALFEEFGRKLAPHPYLEVVLAARLLQAVTGVAAVPEVLTALMSGTERTVLATREPGDQQAFATRQMRARMTDRGVILTGRKSPVQFAQSATHFLVTCWLEGESGEPGRVAVCRVQSGQTGVLVRSLKFVDGTPVGAVELSGAHGELIASGQQAKDALASAQTWGMVLCASEAIGAMRELLATTTGYLDAREQYGRKLSAFQALRFRVVDLFIEIELASASLKRAASRLQNVEQECDVHLAVLGASWLAGRTARRVAQEAVQLHGAIGFTEEALPGRYLKRIEVLGSRFGTPESCLQRYVSGMTQIERVPPIEGVFSQQDQKFAEEVREFVRSHLPADIGDKVRLGLPLEKSDYVRWQKALFEKGWIAGSWPKAHGGTGWTPVQQYIFQSEAGRLNAPDVMPYGVKMVGPVLYTFGTEAQQAEHLPGVLSSDIWWCQGYSEPNAGSDLASLKTRAERQGDHYVVTGTKIWTTQAHYADKMHCLVRTGDQKDRHGSISFLMIDMKAAGVSVRPIESIDGLHHLNQVFLDGVRVPVSQRVGEEGDGWKIATFLLAHERAALAKVAHKERILLRVRQLLEERRESLSDRGDLQAVCTRLAQLEIRLHALEFLELEYLIDAGKSTVSRIYGSILKVAATELQQQLTELGVDILGPDAAMYPQELLKPDGAAVDPRGSAAAVAVYEYLYNRAASIYGGTNEIQRTIIARELFPD
jgi:alkylation response protein AidB-like acyl-CoA dehydrogenase